VVREQRTALTQHEEPGLRGQREVLCLIATEVVAIDFGAREREAREEGLRHVLTDRKCVAYGESVDLRPTLSGMARSHLTLAALATSAVDGLDLAATTSFGAGGDNDFDSALLTGRDGRHWIIRVPRNERAEAEQSADLVALRALSAGVRSRLPFTVSAFVGQVPIDGTRGIVYEFVYGSKAHLDELDAGSDGLAASIGRAIGAIHSLPTSFVADAGLPVMSATESLRSVVSVMDRAAATALVPAQLLGRWERACEDSALWQFQPSVINNSLSAESFLHADGAVTGLLGWHELRIGDPARDLGWILASHNPDVATSALDAYNRVRGSIDRSVAQRATLYAELDAARWLLHGTQLRDSAIVDDAVAMLSAIVDDVENEVMSPLSTRG
jgi:macrolide phosphotransferase